MCRRRIEAQRQRRERVAEERERMRERPAQGWVYQGEHVQQQRKAEEGARHQSRRAAARHDAAATHELPPLAGLACPALVATTARSRRHGPAGTPPADVLGMASPPQSAAAPAAAAATAAGRRARVKPTEAFFS